MNGTDEKTPSEEEMSIVLNENLMSEMPEYEDSDDSSSSFERLVIEDGSCGRSNENMEVTLDKTEEKPSMECINKRHADINLGDDFRYLAFESCMHGETLRSMKFSNSRGINSEEEVLTLTKLRMRSLEHLDISFIEFASPEYSSKKTFSRILWQHIADYACVNWPNLKSISAFGFNIDKLNAIKISANAKNMEAINATVSSAKTSRDILARFPWKLAMRSNLCQNWEKIIEILNTGYAVTVNIVPTFIDIDIEASEFSSLATFQGKMSSFCNIASYSMYAKIFFVYFLVLTRDRLLNHPEALCLSELCYCVVKKERTDAVKMEMELFVECLLDFYNGLDKDDKNTEVAKNVAANIIFVQLYKIIEQCCEGVSFKRIKKKYNQMTMKGTTGASKFDNTFL